MPEQIQDVRIGDISEDPEQPRRLFDEEKIVGGAHTVSELGIQQPVRLRRDGGKLVLVDGARRLRMAAKAGLATVPAIIEEKELSDADVLYRQLVANCQREDFNPMEKARAVEQYMKKGRLTPSQAAANLGFTNVMITRLLAQLEVLEPIQRQIEAGEIPPSAAYELARITDPQKQAEFAARIAKGELTRDGLSGLVKKAKKAADKPAPFGKPVRITLSLGSGRTVTIAGPALDSVEALVTLLEEVLSSARKARTQGLGVSTFSKIMKDQAKS